MVAIAFHKAKCCFCGDEFLWGGFSQVLIDLRELNIQLTGFGKMLKKPVCEKCMEVMSELLYR